MVPRRLTFFMFSLINSVRKRKKELFFCFRLLINSLLKRAVALIKIKPIGKCKGERQFNATDSYFPAIGLGRGR
jgi:hypothetical protein